MIDQNFIELVSFSLNDFSPGGSSRKFKRWPIEFLYSIYIEGLDIIYDKISDFMNEYRYMKLNNSNFQQFKPKNHYNHSVVEDVIAQVDANKNTIHKPNKINNTKYSRWYPDISFYNKIYKNLLNKDYNCMLNINKDYIIKEYYIDKDAGGFYIFPGPDTKDTYFVKIKIKPNSENTDITERIKSILFEYMMYRALVVDNNALANNANKLTMHKNNFDSMLLNYFEELAEKKYEINKYPGYTKRYKERDL